MVALTGCNGGSHITTPASPANPGSSSTGSFSVASVTPASGATQVPITASIQIAFSSAADPATIISANITVTGTSAVPGALAYNTSNNTATFTPGFALENNATYTVAVAGVTSSSGTPLSSTFKSTFTTVAASPSATTQYSVPLLATSASATGGGQISVDTDGNVTAQVSGAAASTTYAIGFCPGASAVKLAAGGATQPACFQVGTVSTNASGSGTSTTMFPQPGDWAGDFELDSGAFNPNGVPAYITGFSSDTPQGTYSATLLPQTKTNGGAVTTETEQEGLSSGSIAISSGALQVTVSGASPVSDYDVLESESVSMDSSGTQEIGQFTTNASGNGSGTISSLTGGDLFQVVQHTGSDAGFVAGFSVP
jgi:Bacterial Ig-like domain